MIKKQTLKMRNTSLNPFDSEKEIEGTENDDEETEEIQEEIWDHNLEELFPFSLTNTPEIEKSKKFLI